MGEGLHPRIRRAGDGDLPAWARAGDSRRKHMARVADLLAGWAEALGLDPEEKVKWRALGFLHDALRDADEAELRLLLERELGGGGGSAGGSPSPEGSGRTEAVVGSGASADQAGWTVDWEAFALGADGIRSGSGPPPPGATEVLQAPPEVLQAPAGVLHGPATAWMLIGEGVEDREILEAVAYHTVGHPELGTAGRALYCADHLEPGRLSDGPGRDRLRARYPEDPDGALQDVLRDRMRYLLERDRAIFLGTVRMWNRFRRPNRSDGAKRRNSPKR